MNISAIVLNLEPINYYTEKRLFGYSKINFEIIQIIVNQPVFHVFLDYEQRLTLVFHAVIFPDMF